ncbi:MAG: peptidoglycan bridge formation glycyltransferase FemA/FemB family protein [Patescibacteria group bacterium]
MEIKDILTEKPWEEFLTKIPHTPFLQSWAWGEFQERLGFSHRRLGIYQGKELVGICAVYLGHRKLGSFAYVPHGPVFKAFDGGMAKAVLAYLKDLARREKVDYLRIEPNWEAANDQQTLLSQAGFRPARSAIPQAGGRTLLLDLALPEEELLANLRKTTRYLVRKGEELGITIERTADQGKLPNFHRLMKLTQTRQHFTPQARAYLEDQFTELAPRRMAELALARYGGEIISAAIEVSYGDTTTYLHGASLKSEVPASHVLLWENIKEAKKDGRSYYDFWGIAPEGADQKHPWWGYTLFKSGFGGYPHDYLGTWDLSLNPKYLGVWAAEELRSLIKRRL